MKKTILALLISFLFSYTTEGQVFSGLIGKYTFDQGTADDEAGTNNGSIMGATLTEDRFGNNGKAFYFNGTSNYILLPYTSVPHLDMIDAITISAWIKPDDINSGLRTIVGKWNGNTNADQFLFTQDGNDNFMAIRAVNTNGINDNSNSITAGNWHHVVFIYDKFDSNRHTIYVDGNAVYNTTIPGFYSGTSANTFTSIGAQYGDVNGANPNITRYFKGAIDDIQIFNRTLSQSEVTQLLNAAPPYNPNDNNGLISKYSFNDGNTIDEVGSNNAIQTNTSLTTDRFGNLNHARNFNGSNSHMYVPNNPSINLDELDAISLSTWIYPSNTATGLRTIIGKWNNDPSSEQYLLAQNGSQLVIAIKGINNQGTSVIANMNPNTWYHIVYAYNKNDNNLQKVYVNNVEVFNSTFGNTYTNTIANTHLSFGAQYGDLNDGVPSLQRFFHGTIDDIHIYNKVLSVNEVDSLYNIPNPITPCVPTFSSISASSCAPYIAPDGQSHTSSGNITAIIPNAEGCDSTISIALTILTNTFSSISPVACANYIAPDGQTYTSSGTYQAVIPNQAGCDSTITINLQIKNTSNTINVASCEAYIAPDGQTYTSSGTYTAIIPNQAGCDSTITIHLQINNPTSNLIYVTACTSYTAPDGQMYSSNGIYTAIIPNQAGCDSTITIHLQINNPTSSSINVTECSSYTAPNGQTYTSSGTYTAIIPNNAGCDSTITINLQIKNSSSSSISITNCSSYIAPDGQTYTSSGIYTATIPNHLECDSIITINLTIPSINTTVTVLENVLTSLQNDATYQWINCQTNLPIENETNQTFTPTQSGNYAVEITMNTCTEISECNNINILSINNDNLKTISVFPNPANDFVTINELPFGASIQIIDISGKMVYNTITQNKEISISTVDLHNGVYVITILDNSVLLTNKKLVVNR